MVPDSLDGSCKLERFAGIAISPRLKNFHTFGCPVYALKGDLQNHGGVTSKWEPRVRLGVNLGLSPRHARSVSLVLNLETGLVSPQFHVKHDEFFETVKPNSGNDHVLSKWQYLSGIKRMGRERRVQLNEMSNTEESDVNPTISSTQNMEQANIPQSEIIHNQEPTISNTTDKNRPNQGHSNMGSYFNKQGVRRSSRLKSESSMLSHQPEYQKYYDAMHEEDFILQDEMKDPVSFVATSNKDTMYWHQAMKQSDANEFRQAAIKEFNDHYERKHWVLIERSQVPKGKNVLPAVWSMKRKRDILTGKIIKYKARLNVHGGKQIQGQDYFETYSPVATWIVIRFLMILCLMLGWKSKQVDFVLAFPQANIEHDMYMELPAGIIPKDRNKDYVLLLRKNLYGQKQASRVFYLYLREGLEKIGFRVSKIDECLFYRSKTMFVVYVDDGIVVDKDMNKVVQVVKDLKEAGYDIEDKSTINDYLGVNFTYLDEETIELTQPQLIQQIIEDSKIMQKKFVPPQVPAKSSQILQRHKDSKPHDRKWHYRSIIGKLNYLEKSTRPDIAYAVHQCARFSSDPKIEHAQAVEYLIKYLEGTKDKGIVMQPKIGLMLEVFADADFCGNWNKNTAQYDVSTAKSRSGFVICFAKVPILWTSKLQTQIALSTTEAEYMALSSALREAIPLTELIKEMRERQIIQLPNHAKVYCKCFEDNSGALELAQTPKIRPRTKHINIIYHHFRDAVKKGMVEIFAISTDDQMADILTKPLNQNLFVRHRKKMMGW